MQRCSINNLKKITLGNNFTIKNFFFISNKFKCFLNEELGGKSPIVVLDDANIDDAVDTAHSVFFIINKKFKLFLIF